MSKTIRITCDTKHSIDPSKLTPLQGSLKSLSDKGYEKIKASLLRHGFVFPEFVWKSGRTVYTVDGHRRPPANAERRHQA